MKIANAIKAYLLQNQICVELLAQRAGISHELLLLAFMGKHRLSIDEYLLVCGALKLPYEYFFENCPQSA